jgi:hypothetical protein
LPVNTTSDPTAKFLAIATPNEVAFSVINDTGCAVVEAVTKGKDRLIVPAVTMPQDAPDTKSKAATKKTFSSSSFFLAASNSA